MSRSSSSAISQTTASRSHNRYPALIILSISFLLLLRQSFATAVSSRATFSKKSNYVGHEYLWYLLIATPEILAVILYSYPGLVPHWREPRNHDVERSDSDSDTPSCSGNRDAREVLWNHDLLWSLVQVDMRLPRVDLWTGLQELANWDFFSLINWPRAIRLRMAQTSKSMWRLVCFIKHMIWRESELWFFWVFFDLYVRFYYMGSLLTLSIRRKVSHETRNRALAPSFLRCTEKPSELPDHLNFLSVWQRITFTAH